MGLDRSQEREGGLRLGLIGLTTLPRHHNPQPSRLEASLDGRACDTPWTHGAIKSWGTRVSPIQ